MNPNNPRPGMAQPMLIASMKGAATVAAPPSGPKVPRHIKIEHRVGVQTPPEVIWAFLSDLSTWESWNPLYPKAEGELRIGQPLTLTLALPGEAPRVIQPRIADWIPNEQIHWRLTLMHGLVRTVRYIEIEALGPESCIFSNGEIFAGLVGSRLPKAQRRTIRQGFEAMGEAVREKAEALWRARSPAPTSAP